MPSNDIESLLFNGGEFKWTGEAPIGTGAVVTFSFPTNPPDYLDAVDRSNFEAMNATHRKHVRTALDEWEKAGGITFVEVPDDVGGDIRFQLYDMSGLTTGFGQDLAGFAYFPPNRSLDEDDIDGDVFMNSNFYSSGSSMAPGRDGYSVLLHEIGHAIGFKHPFEGTPTIDPSRDNSEFTVMSYDRSHDDTTLGSVDKAALKYLYGTKSYEARWSESYEAVVTNATNGGDLIYGWRNNDFVRAEDGNDTIYTGDGNDRIFDGKGNDTVYAGGSGDDYVRVGGGADKFYADGRNDFIDYIDSPNGIRIDLEANFADGSWAANDIIRGFDGIGGSREGDDVIYGTLDVNLIKTYGGDDRVDGRGGGDRIYLGDGDDFVRAYGEEGQTARFSDDRFYGGTGYDYISYVSSFEGVHINLARDTAAGGEAEDDVIRSFEGVSGSATGDDVIFGSSGRNVIKTYGGNDKVYGGAGADRIELGSGNDYVLAGGGQETFAGSSGEDMISYIKSSGGVRIDLRDNEASRSWASNDTISGFESASGSNAGKDVLLGTDSANILKGNGGSDSLFGRGGNDSLYGGTGQDFFDPGAGNDIVVGGPNGDTFHFDKGEDRDRIVDFQNNIDTLEFDGFKSGFDPLAFASQVGNDVHFNLGEGDRVIVDDITILQLVNDVDVV
ncbi:Hemolysin-type calcium-binding repeat-containing protein [Cognatiyoonia koreensis]|uniref:Hemolysin-type calcium-binding repeat-containing protein n=1 Tax=Cognatiyoonia koreensis TaxID=364200 RepID=A0A1I0PCW2_9RHOB|nr:matrixin family metalloprotease [Cognatiyoonia koreensis]SEW12046.1 Hemolysin-type calcium-binding repeat-containing protein [Cognatiyoonia koreensis]